VPPSPTRGEGKSSGIKGGKKFRARFARQKPHNLA